ncbi:RNA-binding protein pop5, partial [Coemansia erecta]
MLEPSLGSADASGQQRSKPLTLGNSDIIKLIRDGVKENYGDSGVGQILAGVQVKHFSQHTCLGIVKVPRDHCKMVLATLALMTHVKKNQCIVRVRHVSGTIKKCQKSAIRTDRELILAWHQRQQKMAAPGTPGDANVNQLLKESESQINALEL